MANVVKWLTHLAVNQACVGSSPIVRPIKSNAMKIAFFYFINYETHA